MTFSYGRDFCKNNFHFLKSKSVRHSRLQSCPVNAHHAWFCTNKKTTRQFSTDSREGGFMRRLFHHFDVCCFTTATARCCATTLLATSRRVPGVAFATPGSICPGFVSKVTQFCADSPSDCNYVWPQGRENYRQQEKWKEGCDSGAFVPTFACDCAKKINKKYYNER